MDAIVVPAVPVSDGTEMQGKKFWPRAGAQLVDLLFVYGITYVTSRGVGYVLGKILFMIASNMGLRFSFIQNTTFGNYVIGIIQMIIYFAVFDWLYGGTLGKIIFGMRVVSSDGSRLSLKQAFIRSLYRFIDGLFFGAVAYSAMKPPKYQRLGDQKANTLVVASNDQGIKDTPEWSKFFIAFAAYLLMDSIVLASAVLIYIRIAY